MVVLVGGLFIMSEVPLCDGMVPTLRPAHGPRPGSHPTAPPSRIPPLLAGKIAALPPVLHVRLHVRFSGGGGVVGGGVVKVLTAPPGAHVGAHALPGDVEVFICIAAARICRDARNQYAHRCIHSSPVFTQAPHVHTVLR